MIYTNKLLEGENISIHMKHFDYTGYNKKDKQEMQWMMQDELEHNKANGIKKKKGKRVDTLGRYMFSDEGKYIHPDDRLPAKTITKQIKDEVKRLDDARRAKSYKNFMRLQNLEKEEWDYEENSDI